MAWMAALERTPEIGPRAAGARYGIHPKYLSAAVAAAREKVGPSYVKQPPGDVQQLGRELGYSLKEIARMKRKRGEEALRRRLQTEWRRRLQDRRLHLHVNPARPPTTDPAQAVEDGEITTISDATNRRLREAKLKTWEKERDLIAGAIDRLKEAGLGNGELFLMKKRLEALDIRIREAA